MRAAQKTKSLKDAKASSLLSVRAKDGLNMVFGKGHTPYFACTIYEVDNGSMPYESQNGISIGIVLKGSSSISCGGYEMKVKQGDEIFMPYYVADVKIEGRLSLIVFRPG